jgi:pimeloyl-ACP methyl ester carboxylesterase
MQRVSSFGGIAVSYDRSGSGAPLVLVHGSFGDHKSNWEFVKPLFKKQFTVYTVARRGRVKATAPKITASKTRAATFSR